MKEGKAGENSQKVLNCTNVLGPCRTTAPSCEKIGRKVEWRKLEVDKICAQPKQVAAQEGATVGLGENQIITFSRKLFRRAQSKTNYKILLKFQKVNGDGPKKLKSSHG